MTISLPIGRRATKCLVPGASAIYLFNEGTGTALRDFSGNGNDGTLGAGAAAPTWTAYGLSFDGGDKVALADGGALLDAGATVQVVVKPGADVTTRQTLVFCGDASMQFAIRNGKCIIYAGGLVDGYYLYSADASVAASTWIDLAATIEWDGALATYINGAPSTTGTTIAATNTGGGASQAIGDMRGTYGLTGSIAAVLVYPSALTPAQVAQNHATLKAMLAARGVTLA
jgi:hypothetical protein